MGEAPAVAFAQDCACHVHALMTTFVSGYVSLTHAAFALQERALSTWAKRLQYYVYETVGSIRMGQFFDIVTDLPESQPALADVRECLKHTSSHARFIQRFSAAIKQRLLHPGASYCLSLRQPCIAMYRV